MSFSTDTSKRFVRKGEIATQRANVHPYGLRNRAQFFEGRIALSSFYATDVAGRGVRFQCQVLLGKPFGFTRRSNPLPENLQRVWFVQPLQASAESDFPSSHYSGDFRVASSKRMAKLYRAGATSEMRFSWRGTAQVAQRDCQKKVSNKTVRQNNRQHGAFLGEKDVRNVSGKNMKTITKGVIITAAVLLASNLHTFAIEGLKLSVQCSNVVLSWPCLDDGSETFIVQYRQTLDPGTPWQTLTTSHFAEFGTNVTYYVHSNIVQNPVCGGGGSFAAMAESGSGDTSTKAFSFFDWGVPLAMRADGSGSIVPLALYPPGYDFSDFLIFDPATSDWLKGTGYVRTMDGPLDPGPMDGDSGGGTNDPPDTGFYRVVRNGAHLFGLTNGTSISDIAMIPVEVGNDSGSLVNLSIVEDGAPVSDVSIEFSPFSGPLQVPVNTAQMPNGPHDIFAHAVWRVTTGTNEGDTYTVEADSPPVTVNVYNEISFTNWMSSFGELGNQLLISAQSAHTDTDWTIDIYGANAGYIGTFAGHTYDGTIYGTWDLTGPPPNFIQYTNEPWFEFKVSTPYADPPIKTYKQTDPWSGRGDWVFAAQHAWDNVLGHEELYNELDGYVQFAQGFGLTVRPGPDGDGHAFTLHVADQSDPQPTSDWASLRQALYHSRSRNFTYLGHGGGDGIGLNSAHTNRFISATEIANTLHTIPAGQTNRHAFRMVILDGCSTATGTLPEAFGIPHKQGMTDQDFLFAAMRPCAFVGWTADKYISIQSGGLNYDHIHFIQHIPEGMLLNGLGIKDAIEYARTRADVHDAFVNGKQFKVFGSQELGINAYNQ